MNMRSKGYIPISEWIFTCVIRVSRSKLSQNHVSHLQIKVVALFFDCFSSQYGFQLRQFGVKYEQISSDGVLKVSFVFKNVIIHQDDLISFEGTWIESCLEVQKWFIQDFSIGHILNKIVYSDLRMNFNLCYPCF